MENSKWSELRFTSWNVRGLNKLTKLKQVMKWLKNLHSKIIFLQKSISQFLKLNMYDEDGLVKLYTQCIIIMLEAF